MELKAKLWTYRGNRHCSDAAQEAFSDSCNTDYIVWRPIKGENDESSHAGHTQCTNGSGQMAEERGGALGILKTHFGKQTYGKVSHSRTVCHKETRSQLHHTAFDSSDKKLAEWTSDHKKGFHSWVRWPNFMWDLLNWRIRFKLFCFYSLAQPDQTCLFCVKGKMKGDWLCFFSSAPEHLISRTLHVALVTGGCF